MTKTNLATRAEESWHRAFETSLLHERKRLGQTYPFHINGRPVRVPGRTLVRLNPSDRRMKLGTVYAASPSHAAKAVRAARDAYPFWRELGWESRLAFVRKAAEILDRHAADMSALLCLETGITRGEAMEELRHAVASIRYYCQQMELNQGYRLTTNRNGSEQTLHGLEPYGVWAALAPFDSPILVAANMIVAAIVAGNTVVYKPSSRTPLCGLRLSEQFQLAGFPVGVVNCLTGPGPEIGSALVADPLIGGFIFTGRRDAAMAIRSQIRRDDVRPCILECGANNPVVVMPTAHLEDAAEGILRSAFARSGQKCSACSRVYVHQKCGADLVALLAERIQEFAIGDPTRRETDMGPLIDAGAVETYRQAVRLGDKSGRRVAGGNVFSAGDLAHGYFVEPTLYDRVAKDCALMREEFLGPVLAVAEVKHVQEAIECCNGGPYGLTAGIFTQVDHEQEQFFNQVEAGSLYCNRREGATTSGTPGVRSFGGWKASGSTGKNALGPYYVAQFMREQCRTICW